MRKQYTITREVHGVIFYWTGCRWSPFRNHAEVYNYHGMAKMDIRAGKMIGAKVMVFS